MNGGLAGTVLPQIDELMQKYEELRLRSRHDGWLAINAADASEFIGHAMAAVHRAVGVDSEFAIVASKALEQVDAGYISEAIPYVGGALKALRRAIAAGYLVSVRELIHAEVFADFLEMADYLLQEGYKDPAAVLVGGTLEGHLRTLCVKNNIAPETPDSRGTPRPKKAETMNADLTREGVHSKLDQKNVTAWLDLRNKAAHGHYDQYTDEQVKLMLQGVTDFLTRHPA